ncbi:MAG: hypothetical protein K8T20_06630 [Planctomycetes bacterium]|nr:hypothetical protein [Planctomycetota bacterium]
MKTVFRSFLPTLAVLSLVFFSGPASAGMIATPNAAGNDVPAHRAAVERLQSRLAEAGEVLPPAALESLDAMPTADLLAMASAVESTVRAGHHHHRWVWFTLGIFVVLAWLLADGVGHHHHHHHPWD